MNTTITAITADTESCNRTDESIPVALLMECEDLAAAYRLCARRSGKEPKQIAAEIDLSYEVLSKVLRKWQEGSDRRYMPNDKVIPFMLACGNSAPLQWLMLQWRSLTGVITLPGEGREQIRVADTLRLQGRLSSIEQKLDTLIAASRGGDNCSLAVNAHWLLDSIMDAALEVGK